MVDYKYTNKKGRIMTEETVFLTPKQLAERWGYSIHTLTAWRHRNRGPEYIRRGYRGILYPVKAVEEFETSNPGFNLKKIAAEENETSHLV